MKQLLYAQAETAYQEPDRVIGYVGAIVGTKRSAYLVSETETTYHEGSAYRYPDKTSARAALDSYIEDKSALVPYAEVIPVLSDVGLFGLPTVGGKHPDIVGDSIEEAFKKLSD